MPSWGGGGDRQTGPCLGLRGRRWSLLKAWPGVGVELSSPSSPCGGDLGCAPTSPSTPPPAGPVSPGTCRRPLSVRQDPPGPSTSPRRTSLSLALEEGDPSFADVFRSFCRICAPLSTSTGSAQWVILEAGKGRAETGKRLASRLREGTGHSASVSTLSLLLFRAIPAAYGGFQSRG